MKIPADTPAWKMRLFKDFQASGRPGILTDDMTGGDGDVPGLFYHSGLHIEYFGEDHYQLMLNNDGWISDDLTQLEWLLFEFGLEEGAFDNL